MAAGRRRRAGQEAGPGGGGAPGAGPGVQPAPGRLVGAEVHAVRRYVSRQRDHPAPVQPCAARPCKSCSVHVQHGTGAAGHCHCHATLHGAVLWVMPWHTHCHAPVAAACCFPNAIAISCIHGVRWLAVVAVLHLPATVARHGWHDLSGESRRVGSLDRLPIWAAKTRFDSCGSKRWRSQLSSLPRQESTLHCRVPHASTKCFCECPCPCCMNARVHEEFGSWKLQVYVCVAT